MVGETRCAASCLGTLSVPQGGVGWSWICGIGLCGGLGAWGVATSLSGGLEATATWGRLAVAGASRLPQGGVETKLDARHPVSAPCLCRRVVWDGLGFAES